MVSSFKVDGRSYPPAADLLCLYITSFGGKGGRRGSPPSVCTYKRKLVACRTGGSRPSCLNCKCRLWMHHERAACMDDLEKESVETIRERPAWLYGTRMRVFFFHPFGFLQVHNLLPPLGRWYFVWRACAGHRSPVRNGMVTIGCVLGGLSQSS